ncbi:MAG: hypothetical protein ACRD9R_23025, partial [Pyrinomonadaceae bacterium]
FGVAPQGDVPQYENVFGGAEPFTAATEPLVSAAAPDAVEFEWNHADAHDAVASAAPAETFTLDPSSSFADLGEELAAIDARPVVAPSDTPAPLPPSFSFNDEHEITLGDTLSAPPSAAASSGNDTAGDDSRQQNALFAQELESVDYYLAQGYADIARDTLDMLERQYGHGPEIASRRQQLLGDDASDKAQTFEPPLPPPQVNESAFSFGERSFADFEITSPTAAAEEAEAVEIDTTMFITMEGAEEGTTSAPASAATPPAPSSSSRQEPGGAGIDPGLAAIFDEFRLAVEETQPDETEDYETHYNLGLAYKDMGLLDEAVEEFQTAIGLVSPHDGTPRYLQCCNLLGHCFMQKDMPRPAAMWFAKGLEAPGHSEEEYQALRYELGAAYEQMGDLDRAIETYTVVYGLDVSYRGVGHKLRELQERKTVTSDE